MRPLQFSTLLVLSLLSASACSSTEQSMPTSSAGSSGMFAVAGAPNGAGSGGSAGTVLAQAGNPNGGAVPSLGGSPGEAGTTSDEAGATSGGSSALEGWRLVWNDEFEGPEGARLDKSKWKYSVGPNNANKELEYYSDRPENSGMDGQGHYLITARKENMNGRAYTSAKFISAGIFSQKYGRFEARIQLPAGKGLWPAFWALGTNINDVGWPSCGEMDIMETVGNQLTINRGSLHGPGYSGGNPLTAQYHLQGGADFSQAFHVFAAEWEENVVRFYVDDELYETRTPKDLSGKRWVFEHAFYMILNVAVGGTFPGNPDDSIFPRTMSIDYVRVYSR